MTQGDRPVESSNKDLIMEDEFGGEEEILEYEVIFAEDVEVIDDDEDGAGSNSGDSSEGSDISDPELDPERKMSCVPSTDHASFVFQKHTGSVFCIGINPKDQNIVITGGQDDKAYVWNTQTGDVLLGSPDTGFTDSVSLAGFSHDGKFVSAIDMGGKMKVWKTTSHPFQLVFENKMDDVLWMKWHPLANVLLVGESSGSMYMWKMPSGECKVMTGERELTDVGGFMPDGKRAIACYLSGAVRVFNLSNSNVSLKYEPSELNNSNFISMDVHPDNNLVALGSLSSKLYLLKTQGAKYIHEYACVEERDRGEGKMAFTSVECVAFSRKLPYNVVIAATDNALHVYDYIKREERGYIPIDEGVTRLVWPEKSNVVFIGTKVGKVAICDVRALQRVGTIEGHSQSILDITMTKDKKTLITSSDDKTVRLFQIEELACVVGFSLDLMSFD